MKDLELRIASRLLVALATFALLVGCASEVSLVGTDSASDPGSSTGAEEDVGSKPATPGMIRTGLMHACAITAKGALRCWGSNLVGALGDGSTQDSLVPVDVVGLSSGVRAVAVADAHTCAVTAAGAVQCWGSNLAGSLGTKATTGSLVPADVVGLSSGVLSLSAGASHTCAVTAKGGVECWGWNPVGQLGDGSTKDSPVPVDVVGLSSGVVSVSAGGNHTCALTSAGAVKCWGDNHEGPLGDGSIKDSLVPVDVIGLSSGVLSLSAGREHNCAILASGAVECWGWNAGRQLGNGSTKDSSAPVDVLGLPSGALAVSAGTMATCAVTAKGAVECWGANFLGQLGDGSTMDSPAPTGALGLSSGVVALSTGVGCTCARAASAAVKCWGFRYDSGNPVTYDTAPVEVMGL